MPRLALAAVAAIVVLSTISPAQAARVLVVQAGQSARLMKTLDAIRAKMAVPVDVVPLTGLDATTWNAALASGERPAVVIALGPRASDYVVRQAGSLPTVHCLAGPDALRAGLPGLPSEVPGDIQATWLKRLVPSARTVGLAFNPAVNARRAEATAAALGIAGYSTWTAPVETPAALPGALGKLASRADVLFALQDPMIYVPEAARGILLQSFRNRIPLIGPNDAWVKLGALYAVDWDYDEVGAMCAQLAAREMQGSKTKVAPPAPPRPRVSVNLNSAQIFGLAWDKALLHSVDHRHE